MPRGDRTGPEGMGPMTGRGAGYCSGSDSPGYVSGGGGRGFFGRGRGSFGGGRGFRHWFRATGLPRWARFGFFRDQGYYGGPGYGADPKEEKRALEDEADRLQSHLDALRKRISEL